MTHRRSGGDEAAHAESSAGDMRAVDFDLLRVIGLTPRECDVLGWVAHGKRDADIARLLGIAPKTVGKHIEHLLAKLQVENRTAAVSVAHQRLRRSDTLRPEKGRS